MAYREQQLTNVERLAEYRVTLYCPTGLSEAEQNGLCSALDAFDFRTKLEEWLTWHTRNRRVLREVTIRVEE